VQKPLFSKCSSIVTNQLFYLWCSFHNRRPYEHVDPRLKIRPLALHPIEAEINQQSSPTRILSDLFWKNLQWNQISDELGLLFAFDTGCGSGRYGSLIDIASHGRLARYKGIDIYEHSDWRQRSFDEKYRFEKFDGKRVGASIPSETNFFMSQSAIEHFRNDLRYFIDVKRFIRTHTERPIMQIHLFPSAACMKLYGRHGYRQYTPRTISKITRLFPESQRFLFGLGGHECNRVHAKYITNPLARDGIDFRKTKPNEYKQAVLNAIQIDQNDGLAESSFWALVICSNWKQSFSL
jgi:hypothetical protein